MPQTTGTLSENARTGSLLAVAQWVPIAILVGILAGAASALLLASLSLATDLREAHHWLILLLAPAGWVVGMLYKHFGRSVEAGNNLILEQVHEPQQTIPFRMAPLILLGTFLTHLFGGSAGREGTAIQTGASLADQLSAPLRMGSPARRILLMSGMSAGFGSVFGTPLAGAVFGIEVLAIGTLTYDAIAPCFLAAYVGDLVTRWFADFLPGAHHTLYAVTGVPALSASGIAYAAVAGVAFGAVAMAFARTTHAITNVSRRFILSPELRPVAGGLLVTCAVYALGTTRYIGLGMPTIVASFHGLVPAHDFVAKFLFTVVTLGSGFKGGEVTPLFFVGSTMGNALSRILPLSPSLLAGMGFVAVFAGAANTPIASTLMAMELFGAQAGVYAGLACVASYLASGHNGIYRAQRVGRSKHVALTLMRRRLAARNAELQDEPTHASNSEA